MVGQEYKLKKEKEEKKGRKLVPFIAKLLLIAGVAMVVFFKAADWGAGHQVIGQPVVAQRLRLQFPIRIEEAKPKIIISPMVEKVAENDFTPIEQKIIDRWGYKDGIVAIAIFDCGESGLNQYAVSHTGDLGVAQINWATWKDRVEGMGKTSADLLNDVDFNLDIAYIIWDRGDGEEGNGEGTWDAWVGYLNGGYLRCLR